MDRLDREAVVARAAVDLDRLDAAVQDLHLRAAAGRELPGEAGERRDGVEHEGVGLVGGGDHQAVIGPGAVGDLDDGVAACRHGDEVVLGIGTGGSAVVEHRIAAPVDHRQPRVADRDAAVEVVDHQRVVARAARDVGHLELVLQVLDDRTRGEMVARIGELVAHRLAGCERHRAAAGGEQVPHHQLVVVQADVEVEGLD